MNSLLKSESIAIEVTEVKLSPDFQVEWFTLKPGSKS
jgi:hypothetical protein